MRLHRFFVKQELNKGKVTISEERLVHQWKQVFRYKKGDAVTIFNGNGKEYQAEIISLEKREGILSILEERESIKLENKITLYQSLIKKDNMEWIVEKATELGVAKIIPIISERSEKKGFNMERAQKIAIEAAEQCGRGDVSEISGVIELRACKIDGNSIVFDTSSSSGLASRLPLAKGKQEPISIFIGPEGGWTEKEIELFKQKGAQIYSLGQLTLRAETAAIVALAKITPSIPLT